MTTGRVAEAAAADGMTTTRVVVAAGAEVA